MPPLTVTPLKEPFAQRGGIWVVAQAGLLLAVTVCGPFLRGDWKSFPALPCGLVLLTIAAFCGLAGAVSLGRNLTPFPRPLVGSKLVQGGIYGWMRHPLYTAVLAAAAGWALAWQSGAAVVSFLVLACFLDAKARREERWLIEKFPEYSDYQRRVRRFIPFLY